MEKSIDFNPKSFEQSWKNFVNNKIKDKEDLFKEKPKNTFKDKIKEILKNKLSEDKPCWKGYKQIGMKKGKNGKEVPNCVPNIK